MIVSAVLNVNKRPVLVCYQFDYDSVIKLNTELYHAAKFHFGDSLCTHYCHAPQCF